MGEELRNCFKQFTYSPQPARGSPPPWGFWLRD